MTKQDSSFLAGTWVQTVSVAGQHSFLADLFRKEKQIFLFNHCLIMFTGNHDCKKSHANYSTSNYVQAEQNSMQNML